MRKTKINLTPISRPSIFEVPVIMNDGGKKK